MFIAFLLSMLLAVLVIFVVTRQEVATLTRHHYLQRVDFFKAHPVNKEDIVMLGDSLTAGGNWDELFPGLPIRNRGINADTTTGVLARLEDVTCGKPKAVFILIGTNDLPWYEYRHDELVLGTYQEILEMIKHDTPKTKIYVQSLLPRATSFGKRIRLLNEQLKKLAEAEGATYIDIHSHLVGEKGELRAELNNDHLHLLAAGYKIWQETLTPYIEKLTR
jgi:lysophospholipase L1-like esterase